MCSSWVGAALLDELALGTIVGFLRFVGIVRFGFDSGGYRSSPIWLAKWGIVKAFAGSVELF